MVIKVVIPVLMFESGLPFPFVVLEFDFVLVELLLAAESILSLVHILLVQVPIEHFDVVRLGPRKHLLQFAVSLG